jgi:hypothetical protein
MKLLSRNHARESRNAVQKEKKNQTRIKYPVKLYFKSDGEIKTRKKKK